MYSGNYANNCSGTNCIRTESISGRRKAKWLV
ncbi:hypothetical protein [Adhaeribacter radiodurans]